MRYFCQAPSTAAEAAPRTRAQAASPLPLTFVPSALRSSLLSGAFVAEERQCTLAGTASDGIEFARNRT